jgi:hypothetical protein
MNWALEFGAVQFMPGIKNLNLSFFLSFFLILNKKNSHKKIKKKLN